MINYNYKVLAINDTVAIAKYLFYRGYKLYKL